PAAEAWLKYEPNDLATTAYIADAAKGMGDDKKFVEYAEKIYTAKPDVALAYDIAQSYKKIGDAAKAKEWTDKTLVDPKYAAKEISSRREAIDKLVKEKNFAKAAETAQLALKTVESAKKPEGVTDADWNKMVTGLKRSSQYLAGVNYYDQDKYAEC